jgi:hypothetical protein
VRFSFTLNYTSLSSSSELSYLTEPVSQNKQHTIMATRVVIRCSRLHLFALTSEWLMQDLFRFHYTNICIRSWWIIEYIFVLRTKGTPQTCFVCILCTTRHGVFHITSKREKTSLNGAGHGVPYHFQQGMVCSILSTSKQVSSSLHIVI